MGIAVDDPPRKYRMTADTHLVPVVLDLSTPEDIQARIDRVPVALRLRKKAVRLCEQAHWQGRSCPTATSPNCWGATTRLSRTS